MIKKRRTYQPRIVGDKVMMPADLRRLHKYMLDIEHIDHISDEMRAVVESEWCVYRKLRLACSGDAVRRGAHAT
jgi:hypothetical protein